jgi:ribosome-binding protein aMBF1 (putative translation factor)
MARAALNALTGTLADLAGALAVSPELVRSWSQGRRTPTPEAASQLAALCRQRAHALTKAADQLEREVAREGRP